MNERIALYQRLPVLPAAEAEHKQAEVLSELTEKYMATIFEKNKQAVEVARPAAITPSTGLPTNSPTSSPIQAPGLSPSPQPVQP